MELCGVNMINVPYLVEICKHRTGISSLFKYLLIFDKNCRCCDTITKHEEFLTFEHPPEILVFSINRFNSNMVNDKNRDGVKVSEVISFFLFL